jgi:hypothetical protein
MRRSIAAPPPRIAYAAGFGSDRLLVLAAVCRAATMCSTSAMGLPAAMRCRRVGRCAV